MHWGEVKFRMTQVRAGALTQHTTKCQSCFQCILTIAMMNHLKILILEHQRYLQQGDLLNNFLTLKVNVFFFLYEDRKLTNPRSHFMFRIYSAGKVSQFSLSNTHHLSIPHRVLWYVVHWPLFPAVNRRIYSCRNLLINTQPWQKLQDTKHISRKEHPGSCIESRVFFPLFRRWQLPFRTLLYKWQRLILMLSQTFDLGFIWPYFFLLKCRTLFSGQIQTPRSIYSFHRLPDCAAEAADTYRGSRFSCDARDTPLPLVPHGSWVSWDPWCSSCPVGSLDTFWTKFSSFSWLQWRIKKYQNHLKWKSWSILFSWGLVRAFFRCPELIWMIRYISYIPGGVFAI